MRLRKRKPCPTCDDCQYMMWPMYPCVECRPQVHRAVKLVGKLIEAWTEDDEKCYGYDDESIIVGVLVKAGLVGEERGDEHWTTRAELLDLLGELFEWAQDAACQGTHGGAWGTPEFEHSFISTWEECDDLFPRVQAALKWSNDG